MLKREEKPITEEMYDRALSNGGILTEADKEKVFTWDEQMRGIYLPIVRKKDDWYSVTYTIFELECDL